MPSSPLGKALAFSLFNVSYHGVHHKYAKMPETELPNFTAELHPTSWDEAPPFPSYRRALVDMLKSLADPRVGPQWR